MAKKKTFAQMLPWADGWRVQTYAHREASRRFKNESGEVEVWPPDEQNAHPFVVVDLCTTKFTTRASLEAYRKAVNQAIDAYWELWNDGE